MSMSSSFDLKIWNPEDDWLLFYRRKSSSLGLPSEAIVQVLVQFDEANGRLRCV